MKIYILIVTIFFNVSPCFSQGKTDSIDTLINPGSNTEVLKDTIANAQNVPVKTYQSVVINLLQGNRFLHFSDNTSFLLHHERKEAGKEFLFYILSAIILLPGIFKSFYASYFSNIFRVFFNTSLRQNQLTDILLQARLPSLLFNVFFIIIGGFYIWLILIHYHLIEPDPRGTLIAVSIALVGFIYLCKFFTLKFIGWVSGTKEVINTYIFVTFLINKIAGIILIPFVVLLSFSQESWKSIIILLSFLVMSVLFLLRFFRSYGLVGNRLSIARFHFLIYIIAVEILPLFLIYKLLMIMLV